MNRRTFFKSLVLVSVCKWLPGMALAGTPANPLPQRSTDKGTGVPHATACQGDFTTDHHGNVVLAEGDYRLLCVLNRRLARLQVSAGHGNFALMDFDTALTHARYDAQIGCFTSAEIAFMEKIFHQDARLYGFKGGKPLKQITASVHQRKLVKVPKTGNFLFTGRSLETYRRMSGDVGHELILTSGIRGIPKQFYLFFRKAVRKRATCRLPRNHLPRRGILTTESVILTWAVSGSEVTISPGCLPEQTFSKSSRISIMSICAIPRRTASGFVLNPGI